jgi:hypothetical protein
MILLLLGLAGYQLVINDALSPPSREELVVAERMYQQAHRDWVTATSNSSSSAETLAGRRKNASFPSPHWLNSAESHSRSRKWHG